MAKNKNISPQDSSTEIEAAEEAVRLAREALEVAVAEFEQLQQQSAVQPEQGQSEQPEDVELNDLLDQTLSMVRKHPGLGISVAALIGFFLGRLFRR